MRRMIVGTVLLCLGTSSFAEPLDPIPARTVISYPEAGGIVLGNGLTVASLDPTSRFCIDARQGSHPINANEVQFQQVVDSSSLADMLRISASAKYRGVKASADYLHDVTLRESDTNIAVVGHYDLMEEFLTNNPDFPRIGTKLEDSLELSALALQSIVAPVSPPFTAATKSLAIAAPVFAAAAVPVVYDFSEPDRTVRLTKAAAKILRKKGVEAFRRECGDFFVANVIHGGRFDGVLVARDTSRDEKTAISASMKGSFGMGSFKTSASRVIQKMNATQRLDVLLRSSGSGPTLNPTKVEDFVTFVENFPSTVPGSAKPVRLVLQSYESLADYRQYAQQTPPALDKIANQYLRFEHLRRNVATLAADGGDGVFLGKITKASTRQLADSLLPLSQALDEAMTGCNNSLATCAYPAAVPGDDYFARAFMPPSRTEWPWATRLGATSARLSQSQAALNATPSTVKHCKWKTDKWGRNKHKCKTVSNPDYQTLAGAVSRDTPCVAWLNANILPLYIHDRIDIWVERPWLARSEVSGSARGEMSYAAIEKLRQAAFAAEGLPYVAKPVPMGCAWAGA